MSNKSFITPDQYTPIINQYNPLYGLSYDQVKERIQEDGHALLHVHNQTEEICKLAVQQDRYALQYVSDEFIHLFN